MNLRAFVVACSLLALAADWPGWLGPNRNGSSPETGLKLDWASGPKVLWKVPGGEGYSSVAVVGNRAYTMVQRGGQEWVLALDTANGKEVWTQKAGPAYDNSYGNGPRSTPLVEGKLVYIQAATGPVLCLEADSGKVVWQVHLLKEFDAQNIDWGLSASPVIDGDLLFVLPGGKGGAVAALHKGTGKVAWKTGDDKPAYASPAVVTVDGKKQVVFFTAVGLLATDTAGKELWRMPWKTAYDVNIATPLAVGKDGLFVSSGEKVGSAFLKLSAGKPSVVWESKGPKGLMTNYWSNAVSHGGHLYGLSGEYNAPFNVNCVSEADGKLAWSQPKIGKGSVTLAEGHLFITLTTGELVLASAQSKAYQEKGRLKVFANGDNKYATVPTIADKKLFWRDGKEIACVDLSK